VLLLFNVRLALWSSQLGFCGNYAVTVRKQGSISIPNIIDPLSHILSIVKCEPFRIGVKLYHPLDKCSPSYAKHFVIGFLTLKCFL